MHALNDLMFAEMHLFKAIINFSKPLLILLCDRYLTAIRTYFTRWLIRTNSFSTICLNPTDG